MTVVRGEPLQRCDAAGVSEEWFDRLQRIFAEMHARGVAHRDAHHRNILVNGDSPGLVDFSTAYVARGSQVRQGRWFRWSRLLDLHCLWKIEQGYFYRGEPPKMFLLYRIIKFRRDETEGLSEQTQ